MAQFYQTLTDDLKAFIAEQKIFFTATAAAEGRINLSPKGGDSLVCLDERTVAFLNLTGSGNETAAHLNDNGRLTLMFCSFSKRPLILRLYGRGECIYPHHPDWDNYCGLFEPIPGARQVIVLHIESVQTSCGFAVPFYDYQGERDALRKWADHKGEAGLQAYWQEKNSVSIDGLPTGIVEPANQFAG
jgi:hypothetical protein